MRPLLPRKAALLPYLDRIDNNRWYSNFGSLNAEYEAKLSERFNCHVCTASSATSALTAALLAALPFHYKSRAMVGMPSWTFAATASAIFSAGFRPLILDVDENNELDPASAGGCQAFVVVAPLGRPISLENWEQFQQKYNCPVIIDAAGGFDTFAQGEIGNIPVVISTHATKVFGTGEGGFVLCADKDKIERIRRITNQGMNPDKSIAELGINAKMSEYHAAIGLAELESWSQKREAWRQVQDWYGEQTDYVISTHDVLLEVSAKPIVEKLASRGIMARSSWYGICHRQAPYMQCYANAMGHDGTIRMKMERTNKLADNTIFLPKFVDMTKEQVAYCKKSLEECL